MCSAMSSLIHEDPGNEIGGQVAAQPLSHYFRGIALGWQGILQLSQFLLLACCEQLMRVKVFTAMK